MKIKGKIFRVGNSFGLRIPKVYVTDGNLDEGVEYEIEVLKKSAGNYSTKPLWYNAGTPSILQEQALPVQYWCITSAERVPVCIGE